MAQPALELVFDGDDARILPDLGKDVDLYARLLPLDTALREQVAIIDIFDGHAMVAGPDPPSEAITDHLYSAGYPITHVPCDLLTLGVFQRQIYRGIATERAETQGISAIGVKTWLDRPFGFRLTSIILPLLALSIACFAAPIWSIRIGALALFLIVGLRIWMNTKPLPPDRPLPASELSPAQTPQFTLFVPLYKEAAILPHLVEQLENLDYPSGGFEVFLLLEANDLQSRAALARVPLPDHFHVFTLPKGHVQTKPRAMNAALPFSSGSIIGVYDAEDAPDPMQLRHVAAAFSQDNSLTCIQAPLDIYNARSAVLSRCFAIEYAMLFRRQNPTLAARNHPLPLGGTSFFVRKDALISLGAWDAFNVTEDADLGLRLHAKGYKTGMIATPTFEEAPSNIAAWIRQRSRWLKGFLLTWITLPAGAIPQFTFMLLLGPVLAAAISLLSIPLWLGTFLDYGSDIQTAIWTFTCIAVISEASLFAIGWMALSDPHLRPLRWYLPVMPFYRFLLIPAFVKAVIEAICLPAFWDKTQHGDAG